MGKVLFQFHCTPFVNFLDNTETGLGEILLLGLLLDTFYITDFHPNKHFNTWFAVAILRFQKLFEVAVLVDVVTWAFWVNFYSKIGQNFIQFSGHTARRYSGNLHLLSFFNR